ncbi:hypothetical protein Ctob_014399 [Chrysochromulina tobinii]|uniref:Cation efflux protein transmembrane domain-containing protein n=1 Tax=Chrysochromulina tobinii TaxID=1460289 RepID=A0A0M0K3X7_9EUKA|nr:hypothetical protein Ctob_014399 [Chrysochromulina tobinii]|eukprot:KOO33515.1 hypothetical protein Ctob_014399 [Chrysochromulina sp. CCMP291]
MAQTAGATAAHSLALMGDTATMAVDSVTYAINIGAEYHKETVGPRAAARIEIGASLLSVVALVAVTISIVISAVARLSEAAAEKDEDVDPLIMLIFTSMNLAVDIGMCGSIVLRRTSGLGAIGYCKSNLVIMAVYGHGAAA